MRHTVPHFTSKPLLPRPSEGWGEQLHPSNLLLRKFGLVEVKPKGAISKSWLHPSVLRGCD